MAPAEGVAKGDWVVAVDSNVHVANSLAMLVGGSYTEFKTTIVVKGKLEAEVRGIGDFKIPVVMDRNDQNSIGYLELKNVLYCPDLPCGIVGNNIFSCYRINFKWDEGMIFNKDTGNSVAAVDYNGYFKIRLEEQEGEDYSVYRKFKHRKVEIEWPYNEQKKWMEYKMLRGAIRNVWPGTPVGRADATDNEKENKSPKATYTIDDLVKFGESAPGSPVGGVNDAPSDISISCSADPSLKSGNDLPGSPSELPAAATLIMEPIAPSTGIVNPAVETATKIAEEPIGTSDKEDYSVKASIEDVEESAGCSKSPVNMPVESSASSIPVDDKNPLVDATIESHDSRPNTPNKPTSVSAAPVTPVKEHRRTSSTSSKGSADMLISPKSETPLNSNSLIDMLVKAHNTPVKGDSPAIVDLGPESDIEVKGHKHSYSTNSTGTVVRYDFTATTPVKRHSRNPSVSSGSEAATPAKQEVEYASSSSCSVASEEGSAKKEPPLTSKEKRWLRDQWDGEQGFLESNGLCIDDQEDREEGRRLLRTIMNAEEEEA